jgi:hypothetical protein
MSFRIAAVAFILIATPAVSQSVTYKGDDALKLKCATTLTLVSGFGEADHKLTPENVLKTRFAAAYLLATLPGNDRDKARAMQAMADRLVSAKSPEALEVDFKRTLSACERFF